MDRIDDDAPASVAIKYDPDDAASLPDTRALFRGHAHAPDLTGGPTPELEPFFLAIEGSVLLFCVAEGRDATDQDLERVYGELRRRPDGRMHDDTSRLHACIRSAVRRYMTEHPICQPVYEAVFARLARSARTFAEPPISRNYVSSLRDHLDIEPRDPGASA